VTFVDVSRDALAVLRHNVEQMGFGDRAEVVPAKAESFLKKPSVHMTLFFSTRPMQKKWRSAGSYRGIKILKSASIVIAEHFKKQSSPEKAGALAPLRESRYGDTVLAFIGLNNCLNRFTAEYAEAAEEMRAGEYAANTEENSS